MCTVDNYKTTQGVQIWISYDYTRVDQSLHMLISATKMVIKMTIIRIQL